MMGDQNAWSETTNNVADDCNDNEAPVQSTRKSFSHKLINLSLKRNITALADANQHKAKQLFESDSQNESFENWLDRSLVAISPSADLIFFASQSSDNLIFIAKLRVDPINQYITKSLTIPLDYDEKFTSVLCLPIMSSQKTAIGLVDWTALVVGLSSGYVKFYTEQSICLLSLKFCDEPVISIKCQTTKNCPNIRSYSHNASIDDELLITYRSCAIVVDGIGLLENLRIAKNEVTRSNSNYEPAYGSANLPSILNCQKWKMEDSSSSDSLILDSDIFGSHQSTEFDMLRSGSTNLEDVPCKTHAKSLLLVGRHPFLAFYREPAESSSFTYTEIFTSIFSYINKPQPSKMREVEVSKSSTISFYDKERLATSIASSPDKRLAAVTDDFGRVLLVDMTNYLIVRIWKGYRSAQCGWVEVPRDPNDVTSPRASFLVIYAPKRGLLEVWSVQRGPRVAAFNVGKGCRLLYAGYMMFNMRISKSLIESSYSSNCYLLNAKSETIFAIELPYTYSMYKYGDLRSRDQLLIVELTGAIQRNSEIGVISEILHRISLEQSLQTAIEEIAFGLLPDKIASIMENLIIKTMKNYDNHSGEAMTCDDRSTIELSKRIIKLCSIYTNLSQTNLQDVSLPDINQRLIEYYEEHPHEVDVLSENLGWHSTEILRYLSLLALERSYRKSEQSSQWSNFEETLSWKEFISSFDLKRAKFSQITKQSDMDRGKLMGGKNDSPEKLCIKLKEFNSGFFAQKTVIKTAFFMYNRLSEDYYKQCQISSSQAANQLSNQITNTYNYLEPSSRLALLFQFWLSTKLCNQWTMWSFLQTQVCKISDELKVIAMADEDDSVLIETWNQIYRLILDSDNIFASIIATAAIKNDTLRIVNDNLKREKLANQDRDGDIDADAKKDLSTTADWESLCIDAERMSLLSQQLEDIFLLSLLLRYSPKESSLVDSFAYRIPRLSVTSILKGGPTIITELVAQWAFQSEINVKIFKQDYGSGEDEDEQSNIVISSTRFDPKSFVLSKNSLSDRDNQDNVKELLHHTKTAFPSSLSADLVIINCVWEYFQQWRSSSTQVDKVLLLNRGLSSLHELSSSELKFNLMNVAYKTFFQRPFERLVHIVETNGSIFNVKSSRLRDSLARKELNMGDESLQGFIEFCCLFSESMMDTCMEMKSPGSRTIEEIESKLLTHDDWWTPTSRNHTGNEFVRTVIRFPNLLSIDYLVELNRLASLMNIIFRLKVSKAQPMLLVGEDSRQVLELDLQQSPAKSVTTTSSGGAVGIRSARERFCRKCIVNIVAGLDDESNQFVDEKSRRNSEESNSSENLASEAQQQQYISAESIRESMALFSSLLTLAKEWELNYDEISLEFAFELYRCNHDKLADQIAQRVSDRGSLARGIFKIASQRVLVLFGLSPHISTSNWHLSRDIWSNFSPSISNWLKDIQKEEMRREIACLSFEDSLRVTEKSESGYKFGLQLYVLRALRRRTKVMLERATNDLATPLERMAFELLRLLDSRTLDDLYESARLSIRT